MTAGGILVISNLEPGDETFDSDVGSWNVTRAKRDCDAGRHKLFAFNVAECLASNENVEVDRDKVAAMVAAPARLAQSPPPIFCAEAGKIWLIDGHHRLRALAQLGVREFTAYVIEAEAAKPYQVFFNGSRVSPWQSKQRQAEDQHDDEDRRGEQKTE